MTSDRPAPFRCPPMFTVTALIAMALLGRIGENMVPGIVIVLSILLLATYITSWRLPPSIIVTWIVRLAVIVTVAIVAQKSSDYYGDAGDPRSIVVLGAVAAAEMVIQCWRVKPAKLSLIFCAGIVYLSGCYQNEVKIVPELTPLFFLLLIMSWRSLENAVSIRLLNKRAILAYLAAIAIALLIGGASNIAVGIYKNNLTTFAQKLLEGQPIPETPGISISPQLGSFYDHGESIGPVMLIRGRLPDSHLRAAAFHQYLNGGWQPGLTNRTFVPIVGNFGKKTSGEEEIHVTKLKYAAGVIFCPLDTDYIELSRQIGTNWCQADAGPIWSQTAVNSIYSFTVSKDKHDILDQPVQRRAMAEDRKIPDSINPKVIVLAKQITLKCKTGSDKVNAICNELDANHGYSLNYDTAPGDPVSGFILSKKPSYCEYFASAAVILLRCSNIPARYVIGYYAHEQDAQGDTIVRLRDSHAWAEAYVGGSWITVDATPADGRPDVLYANDATWQHFIERIEDLLSQIQSEARAIGPEKILVGFAVIFAIYFLARLAYIGWQSRHRQSRIGYSNAGAANTYSDRFQKLLKKRKISIPDGETWFEYFERTLEVPFDRNDALLFIKSYNALRFGGSDDNNVSELMEMLERNHDVKEKV